MSETIFLTLVVAATIVWLAAATAAVFLKNKSAGIRHRTWAWSLIAILISPFVLPWLPENQLHSIASNGSADVASQPDQLIAEPMLPYELPVTVHQRKVIVAENIDSAQGSFIDDRQSVDAAIPTAAPVDVQLDSAPAMIPLTWPTIDIRWIQRVWWSGIVLSCLLGVPAFIRCRRILRRSIEITDRDTITKFREIQSQLGVRQRVALVVSADTSVPFVARCLRPVVVLPSGYGVWSADGLRAVFAHELNHVRRFDLFWQILNQLCLTLLWFHPLAWYAAWRLRVEREAACDDAVVRLGQLPSDYAGYLMEIVGSVRHRRPPAIAMAAGGVQKRISALLNPKTDRSPASSVSAILLTLLFLTTLCGAATLSPRVSVAQEESEPDASPATTVADSKTVFDSATELPKDEIQRLVSERNDAAKSALSKTVSLSVVAGQSMDEVIRQIALEHRVTILLDKDSFTKQGIPLHRIGRINQKDISLQSALRIIANSVVRPRKVAAQVEVRDGAIAIRLPVPWKTSSNRYSPLNSVVYKIVDEKDEPVGGAIVEVLGDDGTYFLTSDAEGICKAIGRQIRFADTVARDKAAISTVGELNVQHLPKPRIGYLPHLLHTKRPTAPFTIVLKDCVPVTVRVTGNSFPVERVAVALEARASFSAITDSEGFAELQIPRDLLPFAKSVYTVHEQYGFQFADLRMKDNECKLDLEFAQTRQIHFTVVDETGQPIKGVSVAPISASQVPDQHAINSFEMSESHITWSSPPAGASWMPTDEHGNAMFRVPSIAATFAVCNEGLQHNWFKINPGENGPQKFTILPAVKVSGRTLDVDGKPIGSVAVMVRPIQAEVVMSDPKGNYSLTVAPDQWFYLEASSNDRTMQGNGGWYHSTTDAAMKDIDLKLAPATRLYGQVELADGQPAGEVQLSCFYSGLPGRRDRVTQGATISNGYWRLLFADKDGKFEHYVLPGDYSLNALNNWGVEGRKLTVVADQKELEVNLRLPKAESNEVAKDEPVKPDASAKAGPEQHLNPKSLSLHQTIAKLRENGDVEAADFLQERMENAIRSHRIHPAWSFVFGRLVVGKGDDPQLCDAQMPIHSSGWFMGSVKHRFKPVGFRMWGYHEAFAQHGGAKSSIANVGDVILRRYEKSDFGAFKGKVKLSRKNVSPSDVQVTVRLASPRTNSGSGGTNGYRDWPEKEQMELDDDLQWTASGLNPMPHRVHITAPGHLPFQKNIEIKSGEELNLGELKILASPKFEIEYLTSDSLDFSKSKTVMRSVYVFDKFRTNLDVEISDWVRAGVMRIRFLEATDTDPSRHYFYCGLSGLTIKDLGKGKLDDFRKPSQQADVEPMRYRAAINQGHVYQVTHRYKSWSHKTLIRIANVEPAE